jgi:hypothetical protein
MPIAESRWRGSPIRHSSIGLPDRDGRLATLPQRLLAPDLGPMSTIRVGIAQTASGPVVDKFQLSIPTNRVDPAALIRQIETRYGRPTTGTAANGAWCSDRCSPLETSPAIRTTLSGSSLQILGKRGQLADDADKAAVKAAADRISPPARRGAF